MSEPSDVPHDRSFSDIQGRPFKLRAEMFNEIDVFSSKYFQLFIQTELDGRHVQTRALVRSRNDLRVHLSLLCSFLRALQHLSLSIRRVLERVPRHDLRGLHKIEAGAALSRQQRVVDGLRHPPEPVRRSYLYERGEN